MESVLLDMAIKGAVVFTLTGAVAASMRSASAAVRHLVWSTGMIGVVVLPVLSALLPGWGISVMPASSAAALQGALPMDAGTTGPPVGWIALWAVRSLHRGMLGNEGARVAGRGPGDEEPDHAGFGAPADLHAMSDDFRPPSIA